jgi:hypothetical protein
MKPNPQEKCIVIKTIGKRIRSPQLFPIINPDNVIATRYPAGGIKNQGLINTASKSEIRFPNKLTGGAKYR